MHRALAIVKVLVLASIFSGCTYLPSVPPSGLVPVDTAAGTSAPGTIEPAVIPTAGLAPAVAKLADDLGKSGVRVERAGEISQPFFSVTGQILRIYGAETQVFAYAGASTATNEASRISADGSTIGNAAIQWKAPPHFFKRSELIVLYVGQDARVLGALREVLGPQFAGAGAGTGPTPAPIAGSISGLVWHDVCATQAEGGIPITPSPNCARQQDGSYRANGILDAGEPGIGGARVSLGAGPCPAGEQIIQTTGQDGAYTFSGLMAGTYCVSVNSLNSSNSALLPGQWTYPPYSQSGAAGVTLNLNNGQNLSGVHFGWDYQLLPIVKATPMPKQCRDQVGFVQDVTIPDNSVLRPGESFLKTWRLRNTGTCTWDTSYSIVFTKGERLSAQESIPLASSIAPGETLDASVNMSAPGSPGTYRSNWELQNERGERFGLRAKDPTFWTLIVVRGSPATPTLALATTPAPSRTPTPSPTATTQAGATPVSLQRIVMPQGATSVAFTTNLTEGRGKGFVLQARADQQIIVAVDNPTVDLQLLGPNGQPITPGEIGTGRVVYQLGVSGDHTLILLGSGQTLVTLDIPVP